MEYRLHKVPRSRSSARDLLGQLDHSSDFDLNKRLAGPVALRQADTHRLLLTDYYSEHFSTV